MELTATHAENAWKCCGTSAGVIPIRGVFPDMEIPHDWTIPPEWEICDDEFGKDVQVLIGQREDGRGYAPPGGHVLDVLDSEWRTRSWEQAAREELLEETGLRVKSLLMAARGWRPNRCTGQEPSGHAWVVYLARVTGSITAEKREFNKGLIWVTRDDLQELAGRTLRYARGQISQQDWVANPGFSVLWVKWFDMARLIAMSEEELAEIEQFMLASRL